MWEAYAYPASVLGEGQREANRMLNDYLQQWSAIQTVRAAELNSRDVVLEYVTAGGDSSELDVHCYLAGLVMIPALQRDVVAHAINELLDATGSLVDGAHYSTYDVASDLGYADYLRTLVLTPDGYDFGAPSLGDRSTSAASSGIAGGGPVGHAVREEEYRTLHEAQEDAEFRRCQALYESGLLDTGSEDRFDRIIAQARNHFGVSSASMALITESSQIIKSVVGPIGQDLPRSLALCAKTIERDRTLVITDASTHPDWRNHPLVTGGPEVRFYAGHPLSTADGWRIGTLCLIDDQPRSFTEDDERELRILAHKAQAEFWVGPLG
ncbi:GAF domain-containing protein [Arthrobacter sp. PL16]|nr:GAF domain-containing protein [Arthrobacter sp. PL16]